ncbi:MAG TPA: DUF2085 domain-containing protein [Vicinamibacterales bacterium]|nr:DUF2085 domain-containing protein [Vicinamibacterales bacterium]
MDLVVALAYAVGSVICHQLPERSFFIDGRQLPVCARCTGLYASGVVGLLGWIALKSARRWRRIAVSPRAALAVVAAAALPTAMSYVTGVTGIWDGSNVTRALLAMPLGVAAGAVVAAVATKDLR